MKMRKETVVILFAFLITTVLFLASAWYVQFHVPLNDFWGVLYYARNLSLAERASLYNGFYPIGYPLLLKLFPADGVIQAAFVSNVLLAGLLLASTAGLISLRDSFVAVAATGVGLLVHPLVVRYANTPGPDIGASAFVSCAVYFLWRDGFLGKDPPAHRMSGIVSGVFLGLASLWRSHAIVISVAIILSYVLVMGPRALWSRREIVLAFAFVYSLQVITNILSGHGPFETAQKFNIYKTFNGIDWGNIPGDLDAKIRSFSFFRLMFEQPLQVIHIIGPAFLAIAVYALPVVPGLIISKDLLTINYSVCFSGIIGCQPPCTDRYLVPVIFVGWISLRRDVGLDQICVHQMASCHRCSRNGLGGRWSLMDSGSVVGCRLCVLTERPTRKRHLYGCGRKACQSGYDFTSAGVYR
jgi:hypothetical protein